MQSGSCTMPQQRASKRVCVGSAVAVVGLQLSTLSSPCRRGGDPSCNSDGAVHPARFFGGSFLLTSALPVIPTPEVSVDHRSPYSN